jgi:DNA-binding CsgD family transcriptional regulator
MLGGMSKERERADCRERLERLSESGLDSESIRREAIASLRRVVGFGRWCWPLADPETLLPGSGLAEHDYGPEVPRSLELEYSSDNFAAKHILARRVNPAGSLHAETGGDLARSPRWDEVLRRAGIGDIAVVACRDALGCWGWIEAYRDGADRRFEEEDLDLLASVGPSLGSALRRNAMSANREGAVERRPPALLLLDGSLRLRSWTGAAREWIDALPSAALNAAWGILPTVIYPAATLARSGARADRAHALLRAVDGRWVMIEAACLEGERDGEIAVTLRSPTPAEIFRLLTRTYALSSRECELVSLLIGGLDTRAVGERLHISPHTVQDHLKSVFRKTGIHSRRELLATLGTSAAD